MTINDKDLDVWIENNFNVLFRGKHGVGKTATVISAFEKHNLKWKYFSAATMDPWVDFVGIPRAVQNAEGGQQIELVRPADFSAGQVEAIFMDELNRAPSKVRNAVMELIQFRSINGIPFPNLRFIWAAVNPDDEEDADTSYDVEALDPAQKDRFQIIVDIPYKPNAVYFRTNYGLEGEAAVEWWNKLSTEAKELVSPRRLEYALKVHGAGGSLRHVLTGNGLNITSLVQRLSTGPIRKKLKELKDADKQTREKEFEDINFTTNALGEIVGNDEYIKEYIEYIPKDMVTGILEKADSKATRVAKKAPSDFIDPLIESLVTSEVAGKSKKVKSKFDKAFKEVPAYKDTLNELNNAYKHTPSVKDISLPLEELLTKSIIAVMNPSLATYYRRSTLNTVNSGIANSSNIVNDKQAVLTAVFLAAIARRSQAATIASPKRGANHFNSAHYSAGYDVDQIEDSLKRYVVSSNLLMPIIADSATKELMSKPAQRMYLANVRGIAQWKTQDFKKVKARFSWWT